MTQRRTSGPAAPRQTQPLPSLLLASLAVLVACGGVSARPGQVGNDNAGEPPALAGITAAHNAVRASVSPAPRAPLPPLTWSTAAASVAQAWADGCNFAHNPNAGERGENIAFFSGSGTAKDAVALWAGEAVSYDYASNRCAGGQVCGHYTQLVWAATTRVGCGVATCDMLGGSGLFVVCDYEPPGNFVGERPY